MQAKPHMLKSEVVDNETGKSQPSEYVSLCLHQLIRFSLTHWCLLEDRSVRLTFCQLKHANHVQGADKLRDVPEPWGG